MLKFFFNKESRIVYAMEIAGIACLITLFLSGWTSGKSGVAHAAFYLFVGLYIFIRVFATLNLYSNDGQPLLQWCTANLFQKRIYRGIELQLKKAMVPTSYIIPIFGGMMLAGAPSFVLYIADLLLVVIAHVNIILLYFYIKDKEPSPVNFFTHNNYSK